MQSPESPRHIRDSLEKHARLFELIRQQNLVATARVGRKARPIDEPIEAALLAAADASLAQGGGYL
ncbi:hypothetical protein ACSSNL_11925 [Thalassobius sp. S69A]|uniref:hypothetical protein n=1 Tax=unclassified Thalassovita TaxID=2619711 RepID=UPI000C6884C1|nr:hypothetical protein [Paracoccaceae bacterium]